MIVTFILVFAGGLLWGRIIEIVPLELFRWIVLVIYVVLPATLLIWCLAAVIRRPRRTWPAPLVTILAAGLFIMTAGPLFKFGGYLNFLSHKGAYDRIVAAAKDGALASTGSENGSREGVRYFYDAKHDDGEIGFQWNREKPTMFPSIIGVVYDEVGCQPPPGPFQRPWTWTTRLAVPPVPEPPPPPPPPGVADSDLPPVMKHGGRMGARYPLQGHYCLLNIVS